MNKILALTIFRAAQFDFDKKIAVLLNGSNIREFEFHLDDILKVVGGTSRNIYVFNLNDLDEKFLGYRISEILIEGPVDYSFPNNAAEFIVPTLATLADTSFRIKLHKSLGVNINDSWENNRIFFSE